MKSFAITSALLLTSITSTAASAIRRQTTATQCCFELYAQSPTLNGTVEEDTIGEERVNSTYPDGNYCVSSSYKGLHDINGNTCTISAGSNRFECYGAGIISNTTFEISNDNTLLGDGSANWFACPSTSQVPDGSYYVYSGQLANTSKCISITLLMGGNSCSALGRPSSNSSTSSAASATKTVAARGIADLVDELFAVASTTAVPSVSATAAVSQVTNSTSVCPTSLSASHLDPSLIVPISATSPNTSYGAGNSASITPSNSTIYAFTIPSEYSSAYTGLCSLLFLFPYGNQAAYEYTFSGTEEELGEKGGLDFGRLVGSINAATTNATTPAVAQDFGKVQIVPGNNYTVATFACPAAGTQIAVQASSRGGVSLTYVEDDNASPLGLYVVPCQ